MQHAASSYTGAALSQISENESAAAEELAATSEELVGDSNTLGMKTDESMSNLSELKEWESVVADHVEKVEKTLKDLLNQSRENEKLSNNRHKINGEVSDSMQLTIEVAQKLSAAVQAMGDNFAKQAEVIERTVSINQDIAESIRKENEQFYSINTMAEGNAGDTAEVTKQAGVISEMVDEMGRILRREA